MRLIYYPGDGLEQSWPPNQDDRECRQAQKRT